MPFELRKHKDGFRLYNTQKKRFVPVVYKTEKTAKAAAINFMSYLPKQSFAKRNRGEKPTMPKKN